MLKKISLFLFAFLFIFVLVGCNFAPTPKEEKFTVSFDCGIECEIEDVEVLKGELVEEPEAPIRDGYIFLGWYNEEELWDFEEDTVTEDITLTAKWEEELEHEHEFVNGKCECGEIDPDYVEPHEHVFVNGKCECGEIDPDYVAPHEHVFV